MIPIDHADDPRLAPYREVRERDLVGRRGGFIAEGEVVLRAALRSGLHPLASVLAADKRAARMQALLDEAGADVPLYVAPQAVMDAVAGFPMHRGMLGHGSRRPDPGAEALLGALPSRCVVLALAGIANHDNMGGLFRNAAAFGAGAVILAEDCCDPLYRKAIRVSVGAALTVPFARLTAGEDLVDTLNSAGFEAVALSPDGEALLADLRCGARVALVLGAEGPGLPPAVLARTRSVRIPMAGRFNSLNVATTGGIALHQLVFGGGWRTEGG